MWCVLTYSHASAVKKIGMVAVRLTCMPGIFEALAVAGAASWIFGMPFALAVSAGFILAAVSPAVVVVGMFNLQQRGYGVAKGIPSLVVAAASFDDVVAISGFSMVPTHRDSWVMTPAVCRSVSNVANFSLLAARAASLARKQPLMKRRYEMRLGLIAGLSSRISAKIWSAPSKSWGDIGEI